jgi:hypothetical protein
MNVALCDTVAQQEVTTRFVQNHWDGRLTILYKSSNQRPLIRVGRLAARCIGPPKGIRGEDPCQSALITAGPAAADQTPRGGFTPAIQQISLHSVRQPAESINVPV